MSRLHTLALVGAVAGGLVGAARGQQPPADPQGSPPLTGPQFEYLNPPPASAAEKSNFTGGLELGLSGADGNSQIFRLVVGADGRYETPDRIMRTSLTYFYANADSAEVQNLAFWYNRFDRLFPGTPLSLYGTGTLEYDRFRAFDLRLTSFAGVGCAWFKNDCTLLQTRIGGGASREYGGDDDLRPEMNFGADVERKLWDRTKFVARGDYYPDITSWGEYRIEAQAAVETLVSVEHNLSLKLGVLERYDSTPTGVRPNDVTYALTVLWRR